MSYNEASYYQSRGTVAYFDKIDIPGARDINGFDTGGSTPEVDITTLRSPRVKFVPGLPDGGGMSMNLISSPHSEISRHFDYSNDKQLTRKVDIYFGRVEDNDNRTAGRAVDVETDLRLFATRGTLPNNYSGPKASGNDFWVGTAEAVTTFPSTQTAVVDSPFYGRYQYDISCSLDTAEGFANGVEAGDFVEIGANFFRIANVARKTVGTGSNKHERVVFSLAKDSAFAATDLFGGAWPTDATAKEATFKIVRPGLHYSIPVYVANFTNNTGAGGLIEMQVAFRITGKGFLYVGNKKATAVQTTGQVGKPDFPTHPDVYGTGSRTAPNWFWKQTF